MKQKTVTKRIFYARNDEKWIKKIIYRGKKTLAIVTIGNVRDEIYMIQNVV